MGDIRNFRKRVQFHTIDIFKKGFYSLGMKKILIPSDAIKASLFGTTGYDEKSLTDAFNKIKLPVEKTQIELVEGDCLDVGLKLQDMKYNPVVLNMASAQQPGGGFMSGAAAQEESLFRRSNLHVCLDGVMKKRLYPFPLLGGVYTPRAIIIKKSEFEKYELLPDLRFMSFVAVAAHRCDKSTDFVKDQEILKPEIEKIMYAKIDAIFKMALVNKHDSIVLSAFGCGAYGNPPEQVAKLFKTCFDTNYSNRFKRVVFAIFDDKNAIRNTKGGNVKPFSEVFKLEPIKLDKLT